MNELTKLEVEAKQLIEKLTPYLPWQSGDVKDEYASGEYIAAVDGAVHDLGALRADIPVEYIEAIEAFIDNAENFGETYNTKFLSRLRIGFLQLKERRELVSQQKSA